jgi:hypothetical protein
MLQEAVDERFGRECSQFELPRVRSPIAKGNLVILQLNQAAVASDNAENIRSQVFQDRAAIPHRLAVNNQSCCHTFDGIRANRVILTKACRNLPRKILESAFTGSRKSCQAGSQV